MDGRVLTVGETMVLLDPLDDEPPHAGQRLQLRIGGAESNIAVGLARLGASVVWVSRLGADPFGDVIESTLREEKVEVVARRDAAATTGLFYKWRENGRSRNLYYRQGSAAGRLVPADVPGELLARSDMVHLTGITTAISPSARAMVIDVARRARAAGVTVLFDPNYRPALWDSAAEAFDAHRDLLGDVSWYLCGLDEACVLLGTKDLTTTAAAMEAVGIERAVIRIGERGAVLKEGDALSEIPLVRVEAVVDEVGAGDGFTVGFAYGLLLSWPSEVCTLAGNLVAARALAGTGDWETFPTLDEFQADLEAARMSDIERVKLKHSDR